MTYGMKIMSLTIKLANKLKTTQRSIERLTLRITFRGRITNDKRKKKKKMCSAIGECEQDTSLDRIQTGGQSK